MKYIIGILLSFSFISCNSDKKILFELRDEGDILYMAESINVDRIAEEKLGRFLLPYEQIEFESKDTTQRNYGLKYNSTNKSVFKDLGEIYSNDSFSINVVLREKMEEGRNIKYFLRTINKYNYVIDNFEIGSWVDKSNRYCYGSINEQLYVKLICDDQIEECFIDVNGRFQSRISDQPFKNQILESHEYLLEKLSLENIEKSQLEIIRVIHYSSFNTGKVVEFSRRENGLKTRILCHEINEYSNPCEEFESNTTIETWDKLVTILNEFDFRTEDEIRVNKDVLDGFVYILEAKLKDPISNGFEYRVLTRGTPFYDKIGSLCEILIEYGETRR